MQLAEAKELLQRVEEVLIDEQVRGCVAEQIACPGCGRPRAHKDSKTIVMRTLFGTVRLASPRWRHCSCQPQPTRTFCPLGRGTAAADHPRTALPRKQVRRAGLVWTECQTAGRDPAARPHAARLSGAAPRAGDR